MQHTSPSHIDGDNPETPVPPIRMYTSRYTQTTPGLTARPKDAVPHPARETPTKCEDGHLDESADSIEGAIVFNGK